MTIAPAQIFIQRAIRYFRSDSTSSQCLLFSGLRLVRKGGGAARDPGHPQAGVRAEDRETQGRERGGLKSDREASDSAQTTNRAELFEK